MLYKIGQSRILPLILEKGSPLPLPAGDFKAGTLGDQVTSPLVFRVQGVKGIGLTLSNICTTNRPLFEKFQEMLYKIVKVAFCR